MLRKEKYNAKPIGANLGAWQKFSTRTGILKKIQGTNYFVAHSGAYISPYALFWLKVKQVLLRGDLIVENLTGKGKMRIPPMREKLNQI